MKLNNHGFTLIELIIAISLVVVVALMFANNMEGINRSTSETSFIRTVNKIKVAATALVSGNQIIEDDIKFGKGYFSVTIRELIEGGLLDKNTIDPRTDAPINREELVNVYYDCQGKYAVTFPVVSTNPIEFMESTPLIVNTFPGGNLSYYDFLNMNSAGFRLITVDGLVKNLTSVASPSTPYQIKVASRTYSSITPGVYKIVYNYIDGIGNCRQHSREITIY